MPINRGSIFTHGAIVSLESARTKLTTASNGTVVGSVGRDEIGVAIVDTFDYVNLSAVWPGTDLAQGLRRLVST